MRAIPIAFTIYFYDREINLLKKYNFLEELCETKLDIDEK